MVSVLLVLIGVGAALVGLAASAVSGCCGAPNGGDSTLALFGIGVGAAVIASGMLLWRGGMSRWFVLVPAAVLPGACLAAAPSSSDLAGVAARTELDGHDAWMPEPPLAPRIAALPRRREVVHDDRRAGSRQPEHGIGVVLRSAAVDEEQVEGRVRQQCQAPVARQHVDVGIVGKELGGGLRQARVDLRAEELRPAANELELVVAQPAFRPSDSVAPGVIASCAARQG